MLPTASSSARTVELVVATLALITLGLRYQLPQGLTLGTVAAVGLAPLWLREVSGFRGARLMLSLGSAMLLSGVLLSALAMPEHDVSRARVVLVSMQVLGLLLGAAVIMWARTILSDGPVVAWVGVGMLLGISPSASLFSTNPWKFGFSVPITVIVLGLSWWWGKRLVEFVAVAALTGASAVTDARSSFAMLVICLCLVVWQARKPLSSKKGSAARVVLASGALAYLVYLLGESLIVGGYLGEETQARTIAQLDSSGSLILGGRPELAATATLMQVRPIGFGPGTQATRTELSEASAGMATVGYDPNNGYVTGYMFGNGIELHSVVGDLWAGFGLVGVAFCLMLLSWSVRASAAAIAQRACSAALLFLVVKMVWNLAFSPFYSSIPLTMLLLGVVLVKVNPYPDLSATPTKSERP